MRQVLPKLLSESSRMVHGSGVWPWRSNEPCCPAESHHETGQLYLHTTLLLQHVWRGYVLHNAHVCVQT